MRNLVLVFILIFFFSVVALFLIRVQSEKTDKEKECFSYKGRWLSKYRECELRGLSEQEEEMPATLWEVITNFVLPHAVTILNQVHAY